jgi:hypothetical protein
MNAWAWRSTCVMDVFMGFPLRTISRAGADDGVCRISAFDSDSNLDVSSYFPAMSQFLRVQVLDWQVFI